MTSFIERRPLTFSAIAVVIPVVALKVVTAGLGALGVSDLAARLAAEAAFAAYVALLLWRTGWWRDAGFVRPQSWRRQAAWLPLLLLPLLILAGGGVKAAGLWQMVGFTLITLLVGFAEEGLTRGVVLRALLPRGVLGAVLVSSSLFGAAHLGNVIAGASPSATVVQAIVATLLGIAFAGARLYGGTIWPAIALHAFVDFVDIAGRGFALPPPQPVSPARAVVPIALAGLCALYGLWLLRQRRA